MSAASLVHPGEQSSRSCQRTSPAALSGPPRTHCGAQGEELEQRGTEAMLGTNLTKAVTHKTRPPLKAWSMSVRDDAVVHEMRRDRRRRCHVVAIGPVE